MRGIVPGKARGIARGEVRENVNLSRFGWLLTAALLVLAGCGNGGGNGSEPLEPTVAALFDSQSVPAALPFPNAVFLGADGRLAMPLDAEIAEDDLGDAIVALNTLDGFSTIAPIHVDFAEAIDETSIASGDNVRVFEVEVDSRGVPSAVLAELLADEDYIVRVSAVQDSRLLIKPLRPLNSASHYLVGLGASLFAQSGLRMGASEDYARLRDAGGDDSDNTDNGVDQQLLGDLVQAQESLLIAAGMDAASLITAFSFPTHSTTDVLESIASAASSMAVSLIRPTMTVAGAPVPLTTLPLSGLAAIFGLTPTGQADVYTGLIELPYYMNIPVDPSDDTVLDSFLQDSTGAPLLGAGGLPQSVPLRVPIMVTIPNTSRDPSLVKPAAGWPVAIYHHGITANRTNVLLIADSLAARGVAMVAIDQSMHGLVPNDAALLPLSVFAGFGVIFYDAVNERHFNLDLDADGEIDLSAANYSSPRNLLTGRDNMRQSVSDLCYLAKTLPNMELPDTPGLAFDPANIHYVSLSLGSIVGSMLAGVNTDIKAFSLSAPGGGGVKFSEGAPNGNAGVIAALAALGLEQGSQSYEDYLTLLTTIGGPGDPINYARRAGELHPIHVTEIIGDGTPENPPDQTIANEVLNSGQYAGLVVETAPLAGTEPLIRTMGLEDLFADAVNPEGLRVAVRFIRGDHQSQLNPSNLLSPFAVPEVTQTIHVQTASFIASGGTAIEIGDSTLVEMNFMPSSP